MQHSVLQKLVLRSRKREICCRKVKDAILFFHMMLAIAVDNFGSQFTRDRSLGKFLIPLHYIPSSRSSCSALFFAQGLMPVWGFAGIPTNAMKAMGPSMKVYLQRGGPNLCSANRIHDLRILTQGCTQCLENDQCVPMRSTSRSHH